MNNSELKELIKIFYDKWINGDGLWRNNFSTHIKKGYLDFTIKVSFGQGLRIVPPKKPWLAFLKYGQQVSQGIYPIIIITDNKLEIHLGISQENEPEMDSNFIVKLKEDIGSKMFKKSDIDSLKEHLDEVLKKFDNAMTNYNINHFNPSIIPKRSLLTKNIILYGSPGVGKTHNTKKLIRLIEDGRSDKDIFEIIKANENSESVDIDNIKERVKFVTFHQSFGYEDFIEGFRPNEEGNIILSDGIFKTICKEAYEDREKNYYLVIDEINRGNISKIFGELITLLEEDKRDKLAVTLPYSKKPFKIPSNLYIIGTMNSTDKSIALIDIALRRRFTFLKMKPKADLINYPKARQIFEEVNRKITETLGEDYQIGHSYFMGIGSDEDLDFVCEYKIEPLLEEYFYGDKDGLKNILEIVKVNEDV